MAQEPLVPEMEAAVLVWVWVWARVRVLVRVQVRVMVVQLGPVSDREPPRPQSPPLHTTLPCASCDGRTIWWQ